MAIEKKLAEWHQKNLIDHDTLQALRKYEASRTSIADHLWRYGLVGLATLCMGLGLLFIVAANWQEIPFGAKLATHILLNCGLGGWVLYNYARTNQSHEWALEISALLTAAAQLSLIALIGQYLHSAAPFADAMLYWWVLITPLLAIAGRRIFSALLLTGLSFYVVASFLDPDPVQYFIPFLLTGIAAFCITLRPAVMTARPHWAKFFHGAGFYGIMILALLFVSFLLFEQNTNTLLLATNSIAALFIGGICIQHGQKLYKTPDTQETAATFYLLGYSSAVMAIPQWIVNSPDALQAIFFCLYFLGVAYLGRRFNRTKWLSVAIAFIAIRMIIYFVSISTTMLMSGLAMCGIGITALVIIRLIIRREQQENRI